MGLSTLAPELILIANGDSWKSEILSKFDVNVGGDGPFHVLLHLGVALHHRQQNADCQQHYPHYPAACSLD